MSGSTNLGQTALMCKRALTVESQALSDSKEREDRAPMDKRIQGGSIVGPLLFKDIRAVNRRNLEDYEPTMQKDNRASGGKGKLCHRYVSASGALDPGKFKEGDKFQIATTQGSLTNYPLKGTMGTIVAIQQDHLLIHPIKGQVAFPPENPEVPLYFLKQSEDLNPSCHKALDLCPDWPEQREDPYLLPNIPADAKALLKDEDISTQEAFLAAISGNDIIGVQGPPGTGKTYLLGKVAAYFLQKGKKVGIVSQSHNAVINALNATKKEMDAHGIKRGIFKYGDEIKGLDASIEVLTKKNKQNKPDCIGATLHAAVRFYGQATDTLSLIGDPTYQSLKRDVLLVDEAGQTPAYMVLALSFLCQRMVLFGDQEQLPPIINGSHPPNNLTACSMMEYLEKTRGQKWLFPLLVSHRMNSVICQVINNYAYSKLKLKAGSNAKLRFTPHPESRLTDDSLTFLNITHYNRSTKSIEEIKAIEHLCKDLLRGELNNGEAIKKEDIIVLSPFRCQARALNTALAKLGIENTGTVHAMQGQGAPIVIFSLTTSSKLLLNNKAAWLFASHEWNVLISRAKAKVIIVGSMQALTSTSPEDWAGLQCKRKVLQIITDPVICPPAYKDINP